MEKRPQTTNRNRWIGKFFNDIAEEFKQNGREEDSRRIYEAFRILNSFYSAVHVPVTYYDASSSEEDSSSRTVAVITGNYKVVNETTVQVTCVPGAMITWEVAKNGVQKNEKRNDNKTEDNNNPSPAASN